MLHANPPNAWGELANRVDYIRMQHSGRATASAGELILGEGGVILEINNISGTVQCAPDSLFAAISGLILQSASFNNDSQFRVFSS
jgi:hypothetical protein